MKSQRGLIFLCLFAIMLGIAALPGGLYAADSIILGKPTANSIAVNVIRDVGGEISFEYGIVSGASGSYDTETGPVSCSSGEPTEVVLSSLQANTRYYYRLRYRASSGNPWTAGDEYTFHTQRDAGSSFVFTVTSDSHFSTNTAQQNAMTNILNDQPDFNLDLGDTFMVDQLSNTQSAVNGRYDTYRGPDYFGKIGPSVPIFLTPGNHEEEEGWNLDDSPSYGVENIQARKAYFPTPINSGFYSGNTDPLAAIDEGTYGDENREDYYAWTWGDALYVVIDEFQYTMDLPYTPTAGEKSDDTVTGDQWSWTLGKQQYDWLKQTLENSDAKYKFVFSHHMLGGVNRPISGVGAGYVRGGAEAAAYYEWGGRNEDGSWGFDTMRSGWGVDAEHPNGTPIHQLFVDNGVSAYFHGHDHQFVYETRDGVVYQEMPSPGMSGSGFSGIYTEGTYSEYSTIEILPNSGYLRIAVNPTEATVQYVSSGNYSSNGTVNYTYTIEPNQTSTGPTGEVIVDGAVSSDTADDVSSITIGHTTGTGADRLMLVGVSWNCGSNDRSITSVTFDGTPLNEVITQQAESEFRYSAIYSLMNPPSGVSGTVTVTFSDSVSNGIVAGIANFAGVNQTSPLGTPGGAGMGSNDDAANVTLTGLSGDELVFDNVFQGASGESQTLTAGADQTPLWTGFAGNARASASTEQATGGSVTMSWTASSASFWAIAAVPINPAPFSGTTWDLTMANDGNGTTTPAEGVHTYAEGNVVNITATPSVGYVFDSWTGDADCADGSVTMDADKTCTANFVQGTNVIPEGTVSTNTADDVSSIAIGHTTGTGADRLMLVGVSWNCGTNDRSITSVTFDGTPLNEVITQQTGSEFRYSAIYSLMNPPSGVSGTVTVTFSDSVSNGIVAGIANFAGVNQTSPLGTPGGAGMGSNDDAANVTLTGLSGNELVFDNVFQGASGESQTLTAGADQTPLWTGFSGNARASASTEQATGGSVTMSWTASSASYWAIAAVPINPAPFSGTTWDLTMANDGNGTTTPAAGVHTYAEGNVVNITATPNVGYVFDSWTGDVADPNSASTTITVDADKTVTANFTAQTYDLTMAVDVSGGGTTTPAAGGPYVYGAGAVVDITATADSGYMFDYWTGDVADPNSASTTVTMDGDKTVTATFSEYVPSPLTQDGAVSSGTVDGDSSISVAHTTGTGTDRLMLVGVSANSYNTTTPISSVTFTPSGGGALALNEVGSIENEAGRLAAIYSLVNPPSNASGTVTVNFSGTIDYGIVVGAANFAGVNQADPLDEFVSAVGTETSAISLDVPTDPDDLVFDTMFLGAATLPSLAADASQSQLWNATLDRVRGVASTEQATGSTTPMSWTASGGATSYYWAIGAVPINPVGSAPKIPAYNIVLGRPTDDSVTVNAILEQGGEVAYEYGTVSGSYGSPTSAEPCTVGEPVEVVISGLSANTQYFYRLLYRVSSGDAWIPGTEHSFHTQRAEGETFTFTITSDSHLGDTFNGNDPDRYDQTTLNVAADNPDFNLDLGDTFIMNDPTNQEEANAVYMAQRPYIGNYSHSAPVFLAIGNHENEEGWNLDDTPFSKALGSINARKKYFSNPITGGIYSGNTDTLAGIDDDQLREDYYAWEWGDVLFIVLDPFQYTMIKPYELDPFNENETETGDQWEWTLGLQQFQWFKDTLENSNAKYKFVFSHHMLGGVPYEAVGGADAGYVRRGAEAASYFEWGGQNEDGTPGFGDERPVAEWGPDPVHQLMIANGVRAFFHGHDHQFVHEERDGIVYQLVPSASMGSGDYGFDLYDDSPYVQPGGNLPNAGHLRVTVSPGDVLVEYVRSTISGDTGVANREVSYSYIISGTTYDLTIAVDPSGSGTASPAVGTTTYSEGAVVSITATPNPGYVFDHWTGAVVDPNAASTTVTMDSNKSVTATFVEVTIPTDMVGYWSFDGGSGIDGSSYGNDATIFGAAPAAGYVGDALDFNGAGDHMVIPDDPSLSMASNSVTVACWIYPASLATEWSTIIQRDNASGSWFDWQLYARASDAPTAFHPVFRMDWDESGESGGIPANEQVEGDIILSTNTWYHIAATYDGSQMKFYIDGTLRGTTPVSGTIPNSGKDIWIGGNEVWGEYFAGLIDELYIFARALSEEEIQALMNPVIDCPGDFDFSGSVNEADLAIFAANFGLTDCSGGCVGDIDPDPKDNDVDALDLLKFIEVFGTYCPY